ncbi:MAG TPA: ion channel [Phycisphaerae bacterium]|nr:ion channel [Phycisphaerae bacterium]
MEWLHLRTIVLPAAGALLILLVFLDVFLTVLFARIGTGIISHPLACYTWRAFRPLSGLFPKHRAALLSLAGPLMLPILVGVWIVLLVLGFALVFYPFLGTGITATSGPTPTNFGIAVYFAGDSLTTVGAPDLAPRYTFLRFTHLICSFTGLSILTLTLTYFLQIYNALQRRNTFALKIHVASAESADAAELLAGLGPEGNFDRGYPQLAEFAAEMTSFQESHHFYPVIFYFRFEDPHYDASRAALVMLDTVSLIKAGLDDRRYAWLKESAAVSQIWRASLRLTAELAAAFLPLGDPGSPPPDPPTPHDVERWRARYYAALRRMRQAGIQTIANEEEAVDTYLDLRSRWNHYIVALASHMVFPMEVVDPATANPAASDRRRTFTARLRDVG